MPAEATVIRTAVGVGGRKINSQPTGARVSQTQGRLNDSDLIRASQRGDRAAFETLVRQYDQTVLRLALRLTNSEADAQDIYQEAFLKAYRHIGSFRFECSFYSSFFYFPLPLPPLLFFCSFLRRARRESFREY